MFPKVFQCWICFNLLFKTSIYRINVFLIGFDFLINQTFSRNIKSIYHLFEMLTSFLQTLLLSFIQKYHENFFFGWMPLQDRTLICLIGIHSQMFFKTGVFKISQSSSRDALAIIFGPCIKIMD